MECIACGRYQDKLTRGMCRKHYQQWIKHNKVLDHNSRTVFDLNEIILHNNYAEMLIYNRLGDKIASTYIDLDDVDKVKKYKWGLEGRYIKNKEVGKLHRFIMSCPEDKLVDHINHNSLDNRRKNLRICTYQQNNMNVSVSKRNKSGVVGVSFHKASKKWAARIKLNKKDIWLGSFEFIEDAIKARREAEIKYFGEYRNKHQ